MPYAFIYVFDVIILPKVNNNPKYFNININTNPKKNKDILVLLQNKRMLVKCCVSVTVNKRQQSKCCLFIKRLCELKYVFVVLGDIKIVFKPFTMLSQIPEKACFV